MGVLDNTPWAAGRPLMPSPAPTPGQERFNKWKSRFSRHRDFPGTRVEGDLRVLSAGGMSASFLNGELGGILRVVRVGGCPGQPALGSNTLIDALNRPRARSPGGSLGRVAACTLIYVSFGEPPATSRAHHPSQAHHIAWFRWSGGGSDDHVVSIPTIPPLN